MKSDYETSKPLVLHALSRFGVDDYYDNIEIFVDVDNHIIVMSSFAFSDNEDFTSKVLLFVFDGQRWVSSERITSGLQWWRGMINNGHFHGYKNDDFLKIYGLSPDMKFAAVPIKIIETDSNKKVFKNENYRDMRELLSLEGHPEKLFIIGQYRESRLLNPLESVRFLTSGGHWGFVTRLYGATFEHGEVTGHYNIPEKLKTNASLAAMDSMVGSNKVHVLWLKAREYTNDPKVVQYSYFDLSEKKWIEPTELFAGYEQSEKTFNVFSSPSLFCNNEDVYCTWSWVVTDRTNANRPVSGKESGVYFCSKIKQRWNKPIKLVDSGIQPRVIADKNGHVYIFWIEAYKGLFYKRRTQSGWTRANLLIKDGLIRTKEVGLPGSSEPPFSIALDANNNFHIAYIRASTGWGGDEFKPEELVYVKLKNIPE